MSDIGTMEKLGGQSTIAEGPLDQPILEVGGSEAEFGSGYDSLRTAFKKLFIDNPDRVENDVDDPKLRKIGLRIRGFASALLTDEDGHYVFSVAAEVDPEGYIGQYASRYTRNSGRAVRRNQIDLFPNDESSHERWVEIWPKIGEVEGDAPQSIWALGDRQHESVLFTEVHASRLANILMSNSVNILSTTQAIDVE